MDTPVLYLCSECANEYCTNVGTNRTCVNCGGFKRKQKPITNYDLLVRKTPEELAKWIHDQIIDRNIGIPSETWLDWLKQEAK